METWFAFRGQELLVRIEERTATLPAPEEWAALGLSGSEPIHVGGLSHAVGLDPDIHPPPGMTFLGLRKLWGRLDEEAWTLAGRAVQIVEWDRNHRFCGRCGTPTERQIRRAFAHLPVLRAPALPAHLPGRDRARGAAATTVCSSPARPTSPRASTAPSPGSWSRASRWRRPSARGAGGGRGRPSRNLRYFGSQPWPFPHSLMIGFMADYAGGEMRLGQDRDRGRPLVRLGRPAPDPAEAEHRPRADRRLFVPARG